MRLPRIRERTAARNWRGILTDTVFDKAATGLFITSTMVALKSPSSKSDTEKKFIESSSAG